VKYVIIFVSFIFLLFLGCGRKQKHIFYFSDKKTFPKINKLSLPVVKGLNIKRDKTSCNLSWFAISPQEITRDNLIFIGYNVYRLVNSCFVPKKPLNKKVITQDIYSDNTITQVENLKEQEKYCYLVRAVFTIYNQKIEGPSSQVVCVKN
jgi:hypothetical protein